MGIFESLLGGGQQGARPQAQQRDTQEFQDFIGRYEQGPPWSGVSDEEAVNRYQQVAPHVTPEVYQQSAQEAYERMTPQQRAEFGQYLRQQARRQNVSFPDFNQDGIDDRMQDPAYLAQVTSRMQQQQPGMLEQLLGGGAARGGARGGGGGAGDQLAGALSNPLAKAALAGIAAMAAKRMMSGR